MTMPIPTDEEVARVAQVAPQPSVQQPAQPQQVQKFDPKPHLITLKKKPYLPVAWRLVWLNNHCDLNKLNFTIETDFISLHEKSAIARAVVKISNSAGVIIKQATGTKTQNSDQFTDFVEKAETGAVGRALAMIGFGAEFDAEEFDETNPETGEPRVVDTPQKSSKPTGNKPANKPAGSSDLLSENKIKRIRAIGTKLFNLTSDALESRLVEAAGKILKTEVATLAALHWKDGSKVMEALEKKAIEKGVWKSQA
jgi:hypothetical protein